MNAMLKLLITIMAGEWRIADHTLDGAQPRAGTRATGGRRRGLVVGQLVRAVVPLPAAGRPQQPSRPASSHAPAPQPTYTGRVCEPPAGAAAAATAEVAAQPDIAAGASPKADAIPIDVCQSAIAKLGIEFKGTTIVRSCRGRLWRCRCRRPRRRLQAGRAASGSRLEMPT